MKEYDLHNHTERSKDGEISGRDLIDMAAERGLKGLGICDHDEFPDESLYSYASEKGIKLALGIEFSCVDCHIIGFNLRHLNDDDYKYLSDKFSEYRADTASVSETVVKSLKKEGIEISIKSIKKAYQRENLNKLYICKYLSEHLDLGFSSWSEARKWLQNKEDESQKEAEKRGEDNYSPTFYPKDGSGTGLFEPLEIIDLIHRSGGYAVWPHPFISPENIRFEYFKSFAEKGIDAVEAGYAYRQNGYKGNESNEELEVIVRQMLTKYNITASGGSDSHYPLKTYNDGTPIMPGDYGLTQDEAEGIMKFFR